MKHFTPSSAENIFATQETDKNGIVKSSSDSLGNSNDNNEEKTEIEENDVEDYKNTELFQEFLKLKQKLANKEQDKKEKTKEEKLEKPTQTEEKKEEKKTEHGFVAERKDSIKKDSYRKEQDKIEESTAKQKNSDPFTPTHKRRKSISDKLKSKVKEKEKEKEKERIKEKDREKERSEKEKEKERERTEKSRNNKDSEPDDKKKVRKNRHRSRKSEGHIDNIEMIISEAKKVENNPILSPRTLQKREKRKSLGSQSFANVLQKGKLAFSKTEKDSKESSPVIFEQDGSNEVEQQEIQHATPISNVSKFYDPIFDGKFNPGSDYFLTDADRELIKKLELKESYKNQFHSNDKKSKEDLDEKEIEAILLREKNRKINLLPEGDTLDLEIRMRNKVVNELLVTERDYIHDLDIVIHHFKEPLLDQNVITEQVATSIFSNIDVLKSINSSMLAKLEKYINSSDGPIGPIYTFFNSLVSKHKIYFDYCNNHNSGSEYATSLMKKSIAFRQFIEDQQSHPICNGMPFLSFLIKPVQRICKYPLLLREILKFTKEGENEKLVEVAEKIASLVNSINEAMRVAGNMSKITKIQRTIGIKDMELHQPGREFIKEGFLEEQAKGEPQLTYYCLFSDMLLRAEKKKSKFSTMRAKDKFQTFEQIPLYNILIEDDKQQDSFDIKYNKKSVKVTALSSVEKNEWIEAIKLQISKFDKDSDVLGINKKSTSEPVPQVVPFSPVSSPRGSFSSPFPINNKIKCFVNKGTPQQRIRKISFLNVNCINDLENAIRREFEWEDSLQFSFVYVDRDGDHIEISSSLSIEEIIEECTSILITTPILC